jgi:hypothetical protein
MLSITPPDQYDMGLKGALVYFKAESSLDTTPVYTSSLTNGCDIAHNMIIDVNEMIGPFIILS